jgi:hypothetical protein
LVNKYKIKSMQAPKEDYTVLKEVDVHHNDVHQPEKDNDEWLNRNLETVSEAGGYKCCRQTCGSFLVCAQCLCSACGEGNVKIVKEG